MAMATGMVTIIGMIMDPDGLTMGAMGMAITGMIMDQGGPTVGTMAMTTIGTIMGPGGLTVVTVVLVGIRVTERMSPQGMAITLTPTSVTPRGTAGIHAPIIIMGIKALYRSAQPRVASPRLLPDLPVYEFARLRS